MNLQIEIENYDNIKNPTIRSLKKAERIVETILKRINKK